MCNHFKQATPSDSGDGTSAWTITSELSFNDAIASTNDSDTIAVGDERFGATVQLTERHLLVTQH